MDKIKGRDGIFYLSLLSLIFVLNDFFLIPSTSYVQWLAVDYFSRFLAIGIIAYLIISQKASWADFGFAKIKLSSFITWTLLLSLSGIIIDQFLGAFLTQHLPLAQTLVFPRITNNALRVFDLIFGLFLVAITEETIFRGYYAAVLRRYALKPALIVFISVFFFGLSHWSLGLDKIITTALWGVLPMVCVLKTGSIYPAIIAHYLTDFIAFLR